MPRTTTGAYVLDGQRYTATQLAQRAGCSIKAMEQRLARGMTPADAVAAGHVMPKVHHHGGALKHRLDGKLVTIRELAARAGCTWEAMQGRLKRGMTVEQAVAAGVRKPRSDRKPVAPKQPKHPKQPKVRASAKPAPAPARRPPLPSLLPAAFAPQQEPIVTSSTKVTVAPVFVDRRFTVDQPTPMFSALRPGQYLEDVR